MQPERITLALLPAHLDYIGNTLARCPYGEVHPILADLQQQVAAYNRARADVGTTGPSNAVEQAPDRN